MLELAVSCFFGPFLLFFCERTTVHPPSPSEQELPFLREFKTVASVTRKEGDRRCHVKVNAARIFCFTEMFIKPLTKQCKLFLVILTKIHIEGVERGKWNAPFLPILSVKRSLCHCVRTHINTHLIIEPSTEFIGIRGTLTSLCMIVALNRQRGEFRPEKRRVWGWA